jgi:hypothetical protein
LDDTHLRFIRRRNGQRGSASLPAWYHLRLSVRRADLAGDCGCYSDVVDAMKSILLICVKCGRKNRSYYKTGMERQEYICLRCRTGQTRAHKNPVIYQVIQCPENQFRPGAQFTSQDAQLMVEKGYFPPGTKLADCDKIYKIIGDELSPQRLVLEEN